MVNTLQRGRQDHHEPICHDRVPHISSELIMGVSGSVKTTLLRNLSIEHIHQGHGVAIIDPHDDLGDPFIRQFWEQEFASYDPRFMREAIAPIQNINSRFPSAKPSSATSAASSPSASATTTPKSSPENSATSSPRQISSTSQNSTPSPASTPTANPSNPNVPA